jgi:hypothetical protein
MMVCPSGAARATISVAMVWLAPGRLSTTTCWRSRSVSRGANARASMSVAPPGTTPTRNRIGRSGYSAHASPAETAHASADSDAPSRRPTMHFPDRSDPLTPP